MTWIFILFSFSPQKAYIARHSLDAHLAQVRYGVPAPVTLAQGILESRSGRSGLARTHNNHFGIKAGRHYRKYASVKDSYLHHARLLAGKRYAPCKKAATLEKYCGCLQSKGYAEDPRYAEKLMAVIRQNNLPETQNALWFLLR